MKRTLIALLALLLVAVTAVTFVACSKDEGEAGGQAGSQKVTTVSKYESGDGFQELKNKASWEGINSFPIKKTGMDIKEARQLCVDFFRYCKTATWIPSENYDIWGDATIHTDGSAPLRSMEGGVVYGGLPYISWATGSIYRMMDYIDEETGVVDMKNAGAKPILFGNQCANGAYVGWARVINSAAYGTTLDALEKNGYMRLGEYTYPDYIEEWKEGYNTESVINENGTDVMLEAYALLKAGDGIVQWTTAGHIVMIATDAVVVRDENGKINPTESYVTIIDQAKAWVPGQHPDGGDQFQYPQNVDVKWNFAKLLKSVYLPFTFKEWTGEDPIEETKVTFSHEGDTITLEQLFSSKITTNYYLFDIYAQIFSSNGSEVCKIAVRSEAANTRELAFREGAFAMDVWGSYDNLSAKENYTVKVYAQLGTGERPVLWEGKLVK